MGKICLCLMISEGFIIPLWIEITQNGIHETPALQVPINVSREVEYESSGTEILVTDILTYAGLALFVLFPIFAAVMLLKKPKRK